jgi:alkyldihydroxyacetonephosphate synthase
VYHASALDAARFELESRPVSALTQDLATLVGAEAVSDDAADRSAYAHDLWPRQLIATRGNLPRPPGPAAVVWPRDREQLAAVLALAKRTGARVTPFGAGSAVTGALALESDVIAVDTKRMRTLHSVDLDAGLAVADAGVLGEHLEEQLERRGATLGHFPSSIYCSTLGGWVATRSAGQCSGRYGKIEDMVVAIDGVLPTGEPFRCGPPRDGSIDARALIVGSEGLFGFVTRATMRIWPAPATRRFASFSYDTVDRAASAIRAIYQAGLRPSVARLYDPFDSYVFKSGGRAHAPRTKSAGRKRPLSEFVLRRILARPELLNRANERHGDRVFGRSLLIVVFEAGQDEPIDVAFERARRIAQDLGGRDEGEAHARRWLARRHAVSYRQPPVFARGLWVDTMEVAAPWSRLSALFADVHAALSRGGFVMAHMSHAYPDGCSIYFTFAGGGSTDAAALDRYLATWDTALEAAHRAGGTVAHHHGIGRSKRAAMRLEVAEGVRVIDALSRAADPGGIVARGPLVPEPGEGSTPFIAEAAAPAFALDATSRVCTVVTDYALEALHRELAAHGFSLPDAPAEGTVARWLADAPARALDADPVDHRVAGYVAKLPDGSIARSIPCPRRAAGPDLFTLFATGRCGSLRSVSLRVRGADETGPAWFGPCDHATEPMDAAIESWLARVDVATK